MKVFLKASSRVESPVEYARKLNEEPRQPAKAATSILDLVGDFHKENCYDRKNKKELHKELTRRR
jgi:hypothetical protein